MWLTDLADVIRANTSLEVIEEPGWKTRGHGPMTSLEAIVLHHTAAPASAYKTNPYPSLKTVRDGRNLGRPDELRGPLAQLGLQRDRKVRVIAAGLCYHAGVVRASWMSNGHTLGIEAEHDGVSPWDPDMYKAYVELVAGLERGYRPAHGALGHKEVCSPPGRKSDPNFNMDPFRAAVAATPTTPPKDEDVALTKQQETDIRAAGWLAQQFAQTAQFETDLDGIDNIESVLPSLATKAEVDGVKTQLDTLTKAVNDLAAKL